MKQGELPVSISLPNKSEIDNANNYPEDYVVSQETKNRVKMLSSSTTRHPVITSRKPLSRRN